MEQGSWAGLKKQESRTASAVPDCWWRHPEIVADLYALQRAELTSYGSDDPGFGPLAFHERLPHAVERLRIHPVRPVASAFKRTRTPR
ncbi:hypothetical protein QK292_17030 [Arthrobacter sp. AL08]|uniref:hypothetical protein n=1 Tax=unclassified Arthrobacter TaxID=235627 RepID=UPI00249CE6B8|nr:MULTISPECIES: hypothetical protein [unclassified Arthrobacter]MDI3243254.1 hypothetical protein [Arthrobacter sp. AL05]MDI3279263.1 hypothetical protein [Arthrobacter sp. AL08]